MSRRPDNQREAELREAIDGLGDYNDEHDRARGREPLTPRLDADRVIDEDRAMRRNAKIGAAVVGGGALLYFLGRWLLRRRRAAIAYGAASPAPPFTIPQP